MLNPGQGTNPNGGFPFPGQQPQMPFGGNSGNFFPMGGQQPQFPFGGTSGGLYPMGNGGNPGFNNPGGQQMPSFGWIINKGVH